MDDLISRQTAIEAVHKNYDTILDFKSDGRTVADSFEDIINALPSAQPERKTGLWEINEHTYACNNRRNWKCTNCCTEKYDFIFTSVCKPEWSYCPNCGADMRGEQNE